MIQWPSKLGGRHKLVGWLNRLLDRSRAAEVKQVVGGRLIENSDGKIIVVGTGDDGGGSVEITDCATGNTYLVAGKLVESP